MEDFTEASIAIFMGRQISIHRHDPFARDGRWATSLALLGPLGAPLCIPGLLYAIRIQSEYGVDPQDIWWNLFFYLFWVLAGIRPVLNAVARRHDRVILYEKGFSFRLRDGAGFRAWDELQSVKHQAEAFHAFDWITQTRDSFTITCQGKPDVVLDAEIRDILGLGHAIQDAVRPRLSGATAQEIEAHGEVAFGPLVIGLNGLRYKQETTIWSEIEKVEVLRWTKGLSFRSRIEIEDVVVRRAGLPEPYVIVPVPEVPNEFVLVDLAGRFLSPAPGPVGERPVAG